MRRYCVRCDVDTHHKGRRCAYCGYRNKKLSGRLEPSNILVLRSGIIEVEYFTSEDVQVSIALDMWLAASCNGSVVDRLRFGKRDFQCHIYVHLTREKAAQLRWEPLNVCPRCDGTGIDPYADRYPGETDECPRCRGTGEDPLETGELRGSPFKGGGWRHG